VSKRVFVTGGGSGLGRALALRYAKAGYRVAIGDINEARLQAVSGELAALTRESLSFKCDTTRIGDLENVRSKIAEAWGGLDIVINNAGTAGASGFIEDLSLKSWQTLIDVNVLGVVRGCKVFVPLLKDQRSGSVINIASSAALMTPPLMSAYTVSKASVLGLSETLRYELSPFGIDVHCVCPGYFKTNLTESLESNGAAMADFVKRVMERSPITSEDIAEQVFQLQESKHFLLIPHQNERKLWRLKRWLPKWFEKKAKQTAQLMVEKLS
jgi:NAD(P)-dependent dehydrogenase (short-subunit alcohol dehydrogenase family)